MFDSVPKTTVSDLMKNGDQITLQEINFAHEYLTDLDIAGAAIRASLITAGNDKAERMDKAMAIFNQPRVQRYLAGIFEDRIARTKITGDRVMHELARIAFNDPVHYFDEFGEIKAMKDMTPSARAAIKEIETKQVVEGRGDDRQVSQVTKIKLYDKQIALNTLLKQMGQLPPDKSNTYNIQYNDNSKHVNTAVNNTMRLTEFSDAEISVMQKMVGNESLEDVLDLEAIEQGCLEDDDYMEKADVE